MIGYEERHNTLVAVEGSKDDLIKAECISDNTSNAEVNFPYKLQDLIRKNAGLDSQARREELGSGALTPDKSTCRTQTPSF